MPVSNMYCERDSKVNLWIMSRLDIVISIMESQIEKGVVLAY